MLDLQVLKTVLTDSVFHPAGIGLSCCLLYTSGIRCRAVADKLPPYAQAEEPSLEDAYLYLISREAVQ